MKSLIYIVFIVYVVATTLFFMGLPIVPRFKMMELLGVGLILIKFAIDYYKNRQTPSYLKYAIYSIVAFLLFNGALFSTGRIPLNITMTLFLLALLAFSMIGLNNSLYLLRTAKNQESLKTSYVYIGIFTMHGLYAIILASALLKGFNLNFLVPSMLIFDLIVLLPFIIVRKQYDQLLVTGLLVISLSINTYLYIMIQNAALH